MIYDGGEARSFDVHLKSSSEIVRDELARSFGIDVDLKSSEIVRDELARSFDVDIDVDLKSSEIVCDEIARSFDVDVDMNTSSEIVREESRISYTRESLLSLSEGEFCKQLPAGVDKSSLSRDFILSYAREDLLTLAELNVCKELPYGFDRSIISSDLQDLSKSAPEIQKLQRHESLSFGRTSEAPTEESVERWDSFKLNDSKSKDSEKFSWHQLQRSWANPTTTGILQNASHNPEKIGILGSWSDTKPSQGESEISSPKLPASSSLLSRCSQPYRPPAYYKALSYLETTKNELNSSKTFGQAESPSKERAIEESWRKDSIDLKSNEQLQVVKEKLNSSEHDEEVIPKTGASSPLQEHSALQIANRFRVTPPPPILSSVSASIEPPCSTSDTESSLTEDSLKNKPLPQGQDEVPNHVQNLQPQILEGSRFSALIILEDAEDVDPNLIDEVDPASNVTLKGNQRSIVDNLRFAKTQKKGSRTQVTLPLTKSTEKINRSITPNNAVRKAAITPAPMKASVRTAASTTPLSKISNSEGGLRMEKHKHIDNGSKDSSNGFAKNISDANHLANASISENWLSSNQTKHENILTDRSDSCKLDSKSVSCSSDSDKTPSNFSSWSDLSHDSIGRASTEMLENPLDKGQSRETSFCDQHLSRSFEEVTSSQISEASNFIPSSLFEDETDSNFELNLPDEDSLITVDDTYIFHEELLNQSPEIPSKGGSTTSRFSGSNKPIQTDSLHQNLILPHQWLHDSQLNIAKLFVNPLNTQADFRSPPQLQYPWRYQHYNYAPFQSNTFPTGNLSWMPQNYEQSLPPAHSFYTHLDNTLPAGPPSYHQVHQMPWRQNEPDLLRNLPQNHQSNINSAYMGMTGCHGGEVELRPTFSQIIQIGRHAETATRPTFSQIIQMQIGMAKMKLESQRAYRKPITKPNR
ncbi:hypothetical protein vseg_001283 [Gypsophila vaccaria]